MATRRTDDGIPGQRKRSPAKTPEERESILVSLAMDEAERQIREGTASSQVITHFVKLGSSREALEQERLRNENAALRKKVEAMESAIQVEQLMSEALRAFRGYSGQPELESPDEDEYDYN